MSRKGLAKIQVSTANPVGCSSALHSFAPALSGCKYRLAMQGQPYEVLSHFIYCPCPYFHESAKPAQLSHAAAPTSALLSQPSPVSLRMTNRATSLNLILQQSRIRNLIPNTMPISLPFTDSFLLRRRHRRLIIMLLIIQ